MIHFPRYLKASSRSSWSRGSRTAEPGLHEILHPRPTYIFPSVKVLSSLFISCSPQSWSPTARACVCYDQTVYDTVDAKLPANLTRCCPNSKKMSLEHRGSSQIVSILLATNVITIY